VATILLFITAAAAFAGLAVRYGVDSRTDAWSQANWAGYSPQTILSSDPLLQLAALQAARATGGRDRGLRWTRARGARARCSYLRDRAASGSLVVSHRHQHAPELEAHPTMSRRLNCIARHNGLCGSAHTDGCAANPALDSASCNPASNCGSNRTMDAWRFLRGVLLFWKRSTSTGRWWQRLEH